MKHIHVWELQNENVIAEYGKGNRGKVFVRGMYKKCFDCPEGRFIPDAKELREVECVKEEKPNKNRFFHMLLSHSYQA